MLEITQKSAWFMEHRIRLARHNGTIEKLKGNVEVDETYIGGKARDSGKDNLDANVRKNVEAGSRVFTDAHSY